jgi:hypothetical protein
LTPAYFTEVRFGCFFSDQRGALMPEFLEPLGAGKDNTFAVSLPELSESDIERLSFRSKTLWLEGSVKYNDVFDNARETAAFFRLWCDPTGGKIPFYTWLNREKPNATNKPDKK